MGARNTNICPAGYRKISSEEECKNATLSFSGKYQLTVRNAKSPSGCYEYNNIGYFYFNSHPIGSADAWEAPICKTGIAGLLSILPAIIFRNCLSCII